MKLIQEYIDDYSKERFEKNDHMVTVTGLKPLKGEGDILIPGTQHRELHFKDSDNFLSYMRTRQPSQEALMKQFQQLTSTQTDE